MGISRPRFFASRRVGFLPAFTRWLTVHSLVILLAGGLMATLPPRASALPGDDPLLLTDAAGGVGVLHRPDVSRPPAGTAFPAVIMLHDGLGADQRSGRYVDQMRAAGFFVLEVELWPNSAEGLGLSPPVHDTALANAGFRRALSALRLHPGVDAQRVAAVGFGMGARALLSAPPETLATEGLVARVLLYPGCRSLATALRGRGRGPGIGSPALILHGEADGLNSRADCAALAEVLAKEASSVRLIGYRHATYGWDLPAYGGYGFSRQPSPEGNGTTVPVVSWPALAEMSAAQVTGFIALAMRSTPTVSSGMPWPVPLAEAD